MADRPILIEAATEQERQLWLATIELVGLLDGIRWVLIGGQMLTIIEREHGGGVGRATVDIDALVDVRASLRATRQAARRLAAAGYEAQPTADGLAYRFVRGGDIVDVLAPERVGLRADLTTEPPWVTLETIGGTQALARRRVVAIAIEDATVDIPVPTLLGALVIKARAVAGSRDHRDKHERDAARLLVLVDDPRSLAASMTRTDRRHLRSLEAMQSVDHPAWRGIPTAVDGAIALGQLLRGT